MPLLFKFIVSFQSFEKRDSRGNHQHEILLTVTDDLRLPISNFSSVRK
jgi:hypothetical protein